MTKHLFFNLLLVLSLFLVCTGLQAQQNQKLIFPVPAGFQKSYGMSTIPTADGGYLVLGAAEFIDWNTIGIDERPRVTRLDAGLQVLWDNLYVPPPQGKGGLTFPKGKAFELPDGDFIIGLHNDSSDVHLLRLNADGSLQFEKAVPGFQRSVELIDLMPDGNLLAFSRGNADALLHFDQDGNQVFSKVITLPGIQEAPLVLVNGDLLFKKNTTQLLTRTDNQGNILWQVQPPADFYTHAIALPGGGFGLSFLVTQTQKWMIRFFDDAGTETGLSAELPLPVNVTGIKAYDDGSFLGYGANSTNRAYLMRFLTDGSLTWSAESPEDGQEPMVSMDGAAPTSDGWAIGTGVSNGDKMGFMRVTANTGFFVNTLHGKIAFDQDENCAVDPGESGLTYSRIIATNGLESFYTFSDGNGAYQLLLPSGSFTLTVEPNEDFFFQCPTAPNTVSFAPNANGNATLDIPIQSLDLIDEIKGKVIMDQNADCIADAGEPGAAYWPMELRYGNKAIHWKSASDGAYQIFVPQGDYSLTLYPWNPNYGICGDAKRDISFSGTDPLVQTEDYVVYPKSNCPDMKLTMENSRLRPCSTNVVTVYYLNYGTVAAENQQMEVILDPSLEYESALPVPSGVDGNILTFDLGDVEPSSSYGPYWTGIKIKTTASCDLQVGQQVCVSAALKNYSPCMHPSSWQGAIVEVDGACSPNSDSVFFKIRNVGNAPNAGLLDFVIDEDQIVLLSGKFQLAPGEEKTYGVLPQFDSTTVSIVAQQEPGAPGDTLVSYSLTNCTGMSGGTGGGLGNNSGPVSINHCFAVFNSYDPNDKLASPVGYGPERMVRPGTPLEYTIRFQNTGNDTAYLVVLRDTLSDKMDVSRIELLGASHPYAFAQINDNILHISFENILLPDSATNPEASQGFFSFRIYPKADLPNGTKVHNRAAIYFDQNPPVITPDVFRTYGEYFILSTDEAAQMKVKVGVYPNPFIETVRFNLPDDVAPAERVLELRDPLGKLTKSVQFSGNSCEITGEGLKSGVHFWSIKEQGRSIASGRVVPIR